MKEELKGLNYSHTAMIREYVSRKIPEGIIRDYSGKYGKGKAVLRPNWESTRYSFIDYYLEQLK